MLFGLCRGDKDYESLKFFKDTGYDYVECNFGALSRMSEEEFLEYKNNLQKAEIPCRASNCFLPGEISVASNDYDKEQIRAYIENGMMRGEQIGMKTVVFGSGKARSVPKGTSYTAAFLNIGVFLKEIVAPIAEKYNITVVIEPLRAVECNFINTVKEGAMLSALGKSDNIHCLCDMFHMVCGSDAFENIKDLKGDIKHAHLCRPVESPESDGGMKKAYPENCAEADYSGFLQSVIYAGCESCSIEAGTENLKEDALKAIKVLKALV